VASVATASTASAVATSTTSRQKLKSMSTIQSNISMTVTGGTPQRHIYERYNQLRNLRQEKPLSRSEKIAVDRQQKCMGPAFPIDIAETKMQCQLIPTNKDTFITGGKTCAFCRERHANYYCFGCHHYFHFGKQSCIIYTKLQLDVD
jgi:hypothetical protein